VGPPAFFALYDRLQILPRFLAKPWLLVECKAPSVNIDHDTFLQAARYNLSLSVPFFALTNGIEHFCLYFNGEVFEFLNDLPDFPAV
jgi:hypothetical protein